MPIRHGIKETARKAGLPVLLLAILLSCGPREAVRPVPRPVNPALLIEKISYDGINSLSAGAGIRIFKNNEVYTYVTGVLNYERPVRLAAALFGPFGVTLMKMVIVNDSIQVYLPNKDTAFRGEIHLPFLLPDSKTLSTFSNYVEETEKDYILNLVRPGDVLPVARYYFTKDTLENRLVEIYKDERPVLRMEIDKIENKLPVKFSISAGNNRFNVTLNNVNINPVTNPAAFAFIEARKTLPLQDFLRTFAPNQ